MRPFKIATITAFLCTMLLTFTFTNVAGFVFDIPKAKGVGNDPIKYSFELGANERISFFFEAKNATVNVNFTEIAADGMIPLFDLDLVNVTTYSYERSRPFAWILNITINATAGYTGNKIDFYAKYTFMRTSGLILSIAVAIAASVIGATCVYLLIANRKVEEKA
ncbi:MAG: hypothetical protein Q6370_016305 [Candidatus Sigynarchaeota archaeon]